MCNIGLFLSKKIPGYTGQTLKKRENLQTLREVFAEKPEDLPVFLDILLTLNIGVGIINEQTTINELLIMVTQSTIESVADNIGKPISVVRQFYQENNIGSFA